MRQEATGLLGNVVLMWRTNVETNAEGDRWSLCGSGGFSVVPSAETLNVTQIC